MGCCGDRIRTMAGALPKVARAIGDPGSWADQQVIRNRRAVCAQCPHARHAELPGGLTYPAICGLCGCLIPLKTKLATESCPDNPPRWAAVSTLAGDENASKANL